MFLLEPPTPGAARDLVFSATDLVEAARCEYAVLRKLDDKLGRGPGLPVVEDDMQKRAAQLGDAHEARVLADYRRQFGDWDGATGVYDVVPADRMERAVLEAKHRETIDALRAGAEVVFQGSFFDGTFHGRADFLVRTDHAAATGDSPVYAVYDTKLARHAKVTALLQLAAYADQLEQAGITAAPTVHLVLGKNVTTTHTLADILPVYRERRDRLLAILHQHRRQGNPVAWGDPRYTACGRCGICQEQVAIHRDLLLVAGMSLFRRKKLIEDGVTTIEQLAAMDLPDGAGSNGVLFRLREQARMQLNGQGADGKVDEVSYKILPHNTLGTIPRPSPGDIFFDFEGDPLWAEPGSTDWGLEYLFGVAEAPAEGAEPEFRAFWAHSRAEERRALVEFLDYVAERRARYPDMHIYHYANYEKAALRRLSLRHVVGEDAVDRLLREEVLVDLYDVVRSSLRISADSYSLKKLEPLYMQDMPRTGEVTDAGASVVAYANYMDARDGGNPEAAGEILASIRAYNRYDCLSTLRLRDWLLVRAAWRGIEPGSQSKAASAQKARAEQPEESAEAMTAEERALREFVAQSLQIDAALQREAGPGKDEPREAGRLSPAAQAVAMVAAAVGYHRRERKQFWWAHFDRLTASLSEWHDIRDVFIVDEAEVLRDWSQQTPRQNPSRELRLTGTLAAGSDYRPGTEVFAMYEQPLPADLRNNDDGTAVRGGWFSATVQEVGSAGGRDVVVLREGLRRNGTEYPELPMALTPGQPLRTNAQEESLQELAARVAAALPHVPEHPGLDILQQRPPRLASLPGLPAVHSEDYTTAITDAVRDLDRSYLAVQGPPGTGKTYVGSQVIGRLVAEGWKVGVVAQSHAVIDNMLRAVIENGADTGIRPEQVAKRRPSRSNGNADSGPASGAGAAGEGTAGEGTACQQLGDADLAELKKGPCVVGGTAWDFAHADRFAEDELDLLVIDEAGQYSLANTLAVTRAARRLLLLGDPQQLPQVTQGKHPEPVDESALGWLSQGRRILPPQLGYFLASTRRMHPELGMAVSALAYNRQLHSHPCTEERSLEGVVPGLECVFVAHRDNSTSSSEEAQEAVRQVKRLVGTAWTEDAGSTARPLAQQDVLVVAAYNAQVRLIGKKLAEAGLPDVRVGTVDKFQGQQAPVVIVSMAASSPAEAPRGMEFLLSRNRINVAISRGQWAAVLIRSPELTNYIPTHPDGLEELGAFVGLCRAARSSIAQPEIPLMTDPEFDEEHRYWRALLAKDHGAPSSWTTT